jgi:hypothetical protein
MSTFPGWTKSFSPFFESNDNNETGYETLFITTIDIESLQNRLLEVCYVPATSTSLKRLLFLLWPLTVLMKQTRQVVCAIKQSILFRCLWLAQTKKVNKPF